MSTYKNSHHPIANQTDEMLFKQYKDSSDAFFMGELYQRYTHLVYGSCLKYLKDAEEAEEAVMEIFEKIMLNAFKYQVEYFKSWLFIVTKNHCLQKLNQRTKAVSIEKTENQPDFMEFQPEIYLNDENEAENHTQQLKPAMEQLKDEQKECIELFYIEGKSYKEVSELTGYSIKNVKSFIQNGKRNLKKILSSIKLLLW
jgi:RNA polymerase sigma-70 factor (ECF subfamily)